MTRRFNNWVMTAAAIVCAVACAGCSEPTVSAAAPVESDVDSHGEADAYETIALRGRVVWTNEALDRRYDIRTVPEARERSLALEGDDGRLYILVEDPQGRAFRRDERLRDRDVELLARYYPGAGMIQAIRVHFLKPEGKFLVDYWCDICSISMIEKGPCDCCQQANVLREQLVE